MMTFKWADYSYAIFLKRKKKDTMLNNTVNVIIYQKDFDCFFEDLFIFDSVAQC